MPTITFTGHSDDLVEVEGDIHGCDEYDVLAQLNASRGNTIGEHTRFAIVHEGIEKLHVIAVYAAGGTWAFLPVLVDEENRLIEGWEIRTEQNPECGYSMLLTLNVPDDATVVHLTS